MAKGLARWARIVLAAADGLENKSIFDLVGTDVGMVSKLRQRFAEHGLNGLDDEPRSETQRMIGDEKIAQVIARTLEETPPESTHWSLRSMARASGYAPSTIEHSASSVQRLHLLAFVCIPFMARKSAVGMTGEYCHDRPTGSSSPTRTRAEPGTD